MCVGAIGRTIGNRLLANRRSRVGGSRGQTPARLAVAGSAGDSATGGNTGQTRPTGTPVGATLLSLNQSTSTARKTLLGS